MNTFCDFKSHLVHLSPSYDPDGLYKVTEGWMRGQIYCTGKLLAHIVSVFWDGPGNAVMKNKLNC